MSTHCTYSSVLPVNVWWGTHIFYHLGLLNDGFQGNVGSTNLLGDSTCFTILHMRVSQLEIHTTTKKTQQQNCSIVAINSLYTYMIDTAYLPTLSSIFVFPVSTCPKTHTTGALSLSKLMFFRFSCLRFCNTESCRRSSEISQIYFPLFQLVCLHLYVFVRIVVIGLCM